MMQGIAVDFSHVIHVYWLYYEKDFLKFISINFMEMSTYSQFIDVLKMIWFCYSNNNVFSDI